MDQALDYREQYHNPYQRNPLTVGQWLMIGAGALAFGGVGYWVYAKVTTKKNGDVAQNGNAAAANNGQAGNPPYQWHQAA